MLDILLESVRALVLFSIVGFLVYVGKNQLSHRNHGWRWILVGFGLLFFGSIIDITDNFEALNRFVVIGDTKLEAFLEKFVGFLGGFIALAVGLVLWLPEELSQRKSAESNLAATSNILATALKSIDQGFLVWDRAHRVVICNDRYHELWNYPKGLLIPGTPLIDLIRHRAESGEYGEGNPAELAEDMLKVILSRVDQPKGHLTTTSDRVLFTRHFSLESFEYITICSDFTDLKKAERALQRSEDQYRQAAVLANLGHWIWDEVEDKMVYCSDEFARIYGISSVTEYWKSVV